MPRTPPGPHPAVTLVLQTANSPAFVCLVDPWRPEGKVKEPLRSNQAFLSSVTLGLERGVGPLNPSWGGEWFPHQGP